MPGFSRLCAALIACILVTLVVSSAAQASVRSDSGRAAAMPSFTEISTGTASGQYSSAAMADFDGMDGYAEIVSGAGQYGGSSEDGLFYWQYSGTAWARTTIKDTGYYGNLVARDMTGDGHPDIVAAGESKWAVGDPSDALGGVFFFEGSHTGSAITFTESTALITSCSVDCVAVGDIEPDGDIDIVAGTAAQGIKVFLRDGSSWDSSPSFSSATETSGIALADLNKDGRLDIIRSKYTGSIGVHLCSPSGAVSYGAAKTSGFPSTDGYDIGVADFDRDGNKDLAIGTGTSLRLYKGNGCSGAENTWWDNSWGTFFGSVEGRKMQVCVADVNQDSWVDVAVAIGHNTGSVCILENNGGTSFTERKPSGLPDGVSDRYYGVALCDWEGDGDLDLAACGWGQGMHFYKSNLDPVVPEIGGMMPLAVAACIAVFMAALISGRKRY